MTTTLPVTSREYKVVLEAAHFSGDEAALINSASTFWQSLLQSIGTSGSAEGQFDTIQKRRTIRFLDTTAQLLYRHDYILRERTNTSNGKKEITLKFRHPDRYISQSRNMRSRRLSNRKLKFEEDIKAPFIQLYSHSITGIPRSSTSAWTLENVIDIFPGLRRQINDNMVSEKISRVHQDPITEIVIGYGYLSLDRSRRILAECVLIAWYEAANLHKPAIVEFSFRYGDKKEQYTAKTAMVAFDIYSTIRENMTTWLGQDSATKTAWMFAVQQS